MHVDSQILLTLGWFEAALRYATKVVCGMEHTSSENSLRDSGLLSLANGRLKGSPIAAYSYLEGQR